MPYSRDHDFLPPDQLFVYEPDGIRAIAIERYASQMISLFETTKEYFIKDVMEEHGLSRTEAEPIVQAQFQTLQQIYREEIADLTNPLNAALSCASEEEDAGNINKAVQIYEELADNAFLASMPYERLRIIYTKQGSYEEAKRICQRYIDVMNRVETYWPNYTSIELLSPYYDHIRRLSSRWKRWNTILELVRIINP